MHVLLELHIQVVDLGMSKTTMSMVSCATSKAI